MSLSRHYNVGLRIGAMVPEDPYSDPKPTPSVGAGPSWWNMDQYRAKAAAWWSTTSKTAPMIIEIKSNGVKLHSIPYEDGASAMAGLDQEMKTPADYAYIAYFKPDNEAPFIVDSIPNLVADKMFVPVTPIVHETVKTVTKEVPSGHGVAVGMGLVGAIGLLALAAKAR